MHQVADMKKIEKVRGAIPHASPPLSGKEFLAPHVPCAFIIGKLIRRFSFSFHKKGGSKKSGRSTMNRPHLAMDFSALYCALYLISAIWIDDLAFNFKILFDNLKGSNV